MKCVYDFSIGGKYFINGQGNKSRYTTLVNVLETGKMQKGNHNKAFILQLIAHNYGKDKIVHHMMESENPLQEERERHELYGGNKGNCQELLDKILREKYPGFKVEYPNANHWLQSWARHGDGYCMQRFDLYNMTSEVKEGIEKVLGNVFP